MNVPKIKTPAPGKPLYTEVEYNWAKSRGIGQNTFGYVFFDTYFKHSDDVFHDVLHSKWCYTHGGLSGSELSEISNEFERRMRNKLDPALQSFLLENDGVIDAWPTVDFTKHIVEKTHAREYDPEEEEYEHDSYIDEIYAISFDYFGSECITDPKDHTKHIRSTPARKLHYDHYMQEGKYEEAVKKEKYLKIDMINAKNNPLEKFKQFIARLPAVIFILADLLLIFGSIFGLEGIREAIGPYVPFYMDLSSVDGYSMLHFVFMPFIGGVLTAFLNGVLDPKVEDVESYAIQKKKYEDYVSSTEYKQILKEGPVNEKEYNHQSYLWHKEWLEATNP